MKLLKKGTPNISYLEGLQSMCTAVVHLVVISAGEVAAEAAVVAGVEAIVGTAVKLQRLVNSSYCTEPTGRKLSNALRLERTSIAADAVVFQQLRL